MIELPPHVALLAASKGQPVEKIQALYRLGQRAFGENYLQEALEKVSILPKDIEWHFIGPIQSNKTKKIAEHFSWVQSIDSFAIAKRLNEQRPLHLPALNICLQVNIDQESQKSGVHPDKVLSLAQACLSLPRLKLRGLMAIPKQHPTVQEQRIPFQRMYQLFDTLQKHDLSLDTLSMGMSEDYLVAIEEGSNMVRIGRALFGERS